MYSNATKEVVIKENLSPQEKWTTIVTKCKEIGKQVLGNKPRTVKFNDHILAELSQKQKKMRSDIISVQSQEKWKEKTIEINKVKAEIRCRLRRNEEDALEKQLKKLEETKNDSKRYHRVMRDAI